MLALVVLTICRAALTQSATAADTDFLECVGEDLAHSSLIGAGRDGVFLTCTYSQAGQCAYSKDGSFSSGSAACPDALSDQNSIYTASTICPKTDDGGSKLMGSGVSGKLKICTYTDAGVCIYSSEGSFSSGGSNCPVDIIPGPCSSPAWNTSSGGPQSDAVITASNADASGQRGGPALIALFVLNAVLVVIILILGVMLIRARRAAGTSSCLKTHYTELDGSQYLESP
ncbi:hypothetical protein K438DRAFT_1072198 [Mycena galopus ATCC 62051]|nr:hypothetical protein K438DRAFT_1072198 [Mycena galopus ATCC 62051]